MPRKPVPIRPSAPNRTNRLASTRKPSAGSKTTAFAKTRNPVGQTRPTAGRAKTVRKPNQRLK